MPEYPSFEAQPKTLKEYAEAVEQEWLEGNEKIKCGKCGAIVTISDLEANGHECPGEESKITQVSSLTLMTEDQAPDKNARIISFKDRVDQEIERRRSREMCVSGNHYLDEGGCAECTGEEE